MNDREVDLAGQRAYALHVARITLLEELHLGLVDRLDQPMRDVKGVEAEVDVRRGLGALWLGRRDVGVHAGHSDRRGVPLDDRMRRQPRRHGLVSCATLQVEHVRGGRVRAFECASAVGIEDGIAAFWSVPPPSRRRASTRQVDGPLVHHQTDRPGRGSPTKRN
jgi:hypothetical protein